MPLEFNRLVFLPIDGCKNKTVDDEQWLQMIMKYYKNKSYVEVATSNITVGGKYQKTVKQERQTSIQARKTN